MGARTASSAAFHSLSTPDLPTHVQFRGGGRASRGPSRGPGYYGPGVAVGDAAGLGVAAGRGDGAPG